VLEQNPKIQVFQTGIEYKHPDDLKKLWENRHRNDNAAAWWVDVILHNKDFSCRKLKDCCKFMYFSADPMLALHHVPYGVFSAAAYLRFRYMGIRYWGERTKGMWADYRTHFINPSLFRENIDSFLPELSFDYQFDDEAEEWSREINATDSINETLLEECLRAYERYVECPEEG
jgi:hypothetical protein